MLQYDGSEIEAFTYWMPKGYVFTEPSAEYLLTVQQGYKDFGLNLVPLMMAYQDVNNKCAPN